MPLDKEGKFMWRVVTAFIFLNLLFSSSVGADWNKAELVVKGNWGKNPGQFGIERHDSGEKEPMGYCITGTGHIVIGDDINTRVQVFSPNGHLYSFFKAKNLTLDKSNDSWPANLKCFSDSIVSSFDRKKQVYDLKGKLKYEWKDISGGVNKILADDSFITVFNKAYSKYSPSGELLYKYEGIPPEVGERLGEDHQNGEIKSTINVNRTVYSFTTKTYVQNYSVDKIENINVLSYNGEDLARYRFSKFDKCGKLVASIDLPHKFGDPQISANGDIYAVSGDIDYRIYRWRWQGKPNIHTGPPPPNNTRTKSMPERIIVRWNPSPQDPGCVTGYEIVRKDGDGGNFEIISKVSNNVTEFKDESVLPGKSYIYRVRAISGNLFSDFSNETTGRLKDRKPSQSQ